MFERSPRLTVSKAFRSIDLGDGWLYFTNENYFLGQRIRALTDPELANRVDIDFNTYALVSGAYGLRDMEGAPSWPI